MDMLPIQPNKNGFIRPTIATANDGGSKSQSGYIKRAEKNDKLNISDESKRLIGEEQEIEEENNNFLIDLLISLKDFILSLFKFISKILSFKLSKIKKESQKIEKEIKKESFLAYTGKHE